MSNGVIPFANANNKISTYDGNNLLEIFGSAAALHAAISSGDFTRIQIGDYYPLHLTGTFRNAATAADVEIDEDAIMEVAAINPYIRQGPTEFLPQHVLFCSRQCISPALQYRSEPAVWYNPAEENPWRGSALYATLNDPTNGVITLVEETALGAYIYKGDNNNGIMSYMEKAGVDSTAPTSADWQGRGALFLPSECEVYGHIERSPRTNSTGSGLYNQWPIFAGSMRHIIKSTSNTATGRAYWWLQDMFNNRYICCVAPQGNSGAVTASTTSPRVPLCFLIT